MWAAGKAGRWSHDLMSSALSHSDTPLGLTVLDGRTQDLAAPGVLPQLVKDPAAYCVEYTDGTRATLLMLNGAIKDFNISARVEGHGLVSTQFFMTPPPNETHSVTIEWPGGSLPVTDGSGSQTLDVSPVGSAS